MNIEKFTWPSEGIQFEVTGKVIGKGRPRFSTRGGFVKTYTPKQTVEYEDSIKNAYISNSRHISSKSICLILKVCFAPNKSDTKKNKAIKLSNLLKPRKKPDIDNVVKCVLDALNGIAYKDDTQVNEIHVIRCYAEKEKLVICLKENGELIQK